MLSRSGARDLPAAGLLTESLIETSYSATRRRVHRRPEKKAGPTSSSARRPTTRCSRSGSSIPTSAASHMTKHTILFLAANPYGIDPRALDREARAIQVELERSGHRDRCELVTRWAAEPLDLLRELRRLRPTVVHFSGRGGHLVPSGHHASGTPVRDVVSEDRRDREAPAMTCTFRAPTTKRAGCRPRRSRTRSAPRDPLFRSWCSMRATAPTQAEALLAHVDCVVSTRGTIRDDAARSFAIGFYGGLGERESIAAAYLQGCAAISLEASPTRNGRSSPCATASMPSSWCWPWTHLQALRKPVRPPKR